MSEVKISIMRFLFIVTELFSANGVCVQAIMNELHADGHKVFCLTNREQGPNSQHKSCKATVYTVRPRWMYTMMKYMERVKGKYRRKFLSKVWRIMNKARLALAVPTWPLISPLYSIRYSRKVSEIHNEVGFDIIIPVYSQIDPLIAACYLKHKNKSVVVIPYLLDSLSGGYGPRVFSDSWIKHRGIHWERLLFKNADAVIAMNSSKDHYLHIGYEEAYVAKMRYLDIPLFIPSAMDSKQKKIDGKISLLYLGTVKRGVRSARHFLQVLSMLDDVPFEMFFYGTDLDELRTMIQNIDNIPWLHVMAGVDHASAKKLIHTADYLVNFGNKNPNMVPSKVFEYMSSGKPIISTRPSKLDPSAEYLSKYPDACILDERSTIEDNAGQLRQFLSQSRSAVDVIALERVLYLNTPKAFIDTISEIMAKRKGSGANHDGLSTSD